jgi:hypothetical protein
MLQFIINLIAGVAGGNALGSLLKQFSLGPALNSIVGLIGGGLSSQLLGPIINPGGHLDVGSLLSGILSSGAGGAILTAIVGLIKGKIA